MVIKKQTLRTVLDVPITKSKRIEISELSDGCGIKVMLADSCAGNTIRTLLGVISPTKDNNAKITFLSWHLQQHAILSPNEKPCDLFGEYLTVNRNNGRIFAEVSEETEEFIVKVGFQSPTRKGSFISRPVAGFSVDKQLKRGERIYIYGNVIDSQVPYTHIELLRQD